ncbi:unnamed protein product [Paramecium sonneborni]|uniref:Uncharacterized protein n=1 Tax=Paramecium sonneborni TaxID=65129 RepID=A0A8S1Q5Q2_9CILI|nr:unnamed protein product [Paramecium sonneborni]
MENEGLESKLQKRNNLAENLNKLCQSMELCNESKLFMDKGRVQRSGLQPHQKYKQKNLKILLIIQKYLFQILLNNMMKKLLQNLQEIERVYLSWLVLKMKKLNF